MDLSPRRHAPRPRADSLRRRAASAGTTYNHALRSLVDGCITVFELGFRHANCESVYCVQPQRLSPVQLDASGSRSRAPRCLTMPRPCAAVSDHAAPRSEDDIRAELEACADAGSSERVCETVSIVFITLETLPAGTLKRWGKAEAVSNRSKALWRGFCRCAAGRRDAAALRCRADERCEGSSATRISSRATHGSPSTGCSWSRQPRWGAWRRRRSWRSACRWCIRRVGRLLWVRF